MSILINYLFIDLVLLIFFCILGRNYIFNNSLFSFIFFFHALPRTLWYWHEHVKFNRNAVSFVLNSRKKFLNDFPEDVDSNRLRDYCFPLPGELLELFNFLLIDINNYNSSIKLFQNFPMFGMFFLIIFEHRFKIYSRTSYYRTTLLSRINGNIFRIHGNIRINNILHV